MPFNLEQFKSGTPAYTRDGRKATFIGICEDCFEEGQLVLKLSDSVLPTSYYLDGSDGEFVRASTSIGDLVSMQGSLDHIKPGEPVMVWNADTHPLKARLRLFVAPEDLSEGIKTKVHQPQHSINTDIYTNCLPVPEYVDTYLK